MFKRKPEYLRWEEKWEYDEWTACLDCEEPTKYATLMCHKCGASEAFRPYIVAAKLTKGYIALKHVAFMLRDGRVVPISEFAQMVRDKREARYSKKENFAYPYHK